MENMYLDCDECIAVIVGGLPYIKRDKRNKKNKKISRRKRSRIKFKCKRKNLLEMWK